MAPLTVPRRAAVVAVGLVILVVAGGFAVVLPPVARIDAALVSVAVPARDATALAVAFAFDALGSNAIAIAAIPLAAATLLLLRRRPWSALVVVLAPALVGLAVQQLKRAFGRPRPADGVIELASAAYPSGHVANAATLVVLAAVLLPRWWTTLGAVVVIVLMASSRILLGAHWPTDTLAGALLGAATALLVVAVLHRPLRRETEGSAASVGG